ncbi:hypothetical protein [Nocardioides sp.]|uniref:hypothetical protein n=1 Tax=Nocardioides sp. TaxID=35761 RepID=UPI00356B468B
MKTRVRPWLGWIVALALVMAIGGSLGSQAVGGPTVLTLSKAKKVFVTKKKAKRTYVTKAQAASHLSAVGADKRYLPRSGETRVPVLPQSWALADNTSNVVIAPRQTYTILQKNSMAGSDVDFFAPVPVPSRIGGLAFKVVGIELCYAFPVPGGTSPIVDRITLQRGAPSTANPVPVSLSTVATDETGRVDNACTTFRFSPIALLPNGVVGVGLRIDYPSANTQVYLGAGSLILTS